MSPRMTAPFLPREVVIAAAARTPIGSFMGGLAALSAPALGSIAISNAIKRSRLETSDVDEVVVGHVLQAGCGQASARQAAIHAKIPPNVDVYGVNKVCSSGLKAITLGAQSIGLGHSNVVVAAGMESMSNAPYYLNKARNGGYKYGHGSLLDSIVHDGLWDPYNQMHMGQCAEKTASEFGISRVEQDSYAVESYRRAAAAWNDGLMGREVVPVHPPNDPPKVSVERDEEYSKLKLDKVSGLKPSFEKTGTITAANASKLNDGAAAVVLLSLERAKQLDLPGLFRIVSFADAAVEPIDFPVAPTQAIHKAFKLAGLSKSDVDYYEINEAFSCVAIANIKALDLDTSVVNVHGGAVALGHPLGMSGTRIVMSLINVLQSRDAALGCAAICNGGGGATAIVVERLQ